MTNLLDKGKSRLDCGKNTKGSFNSFYNVVKSAENNIPIVDILNLVQGKLTPESGSVLLGGASVHSRQKWPGQGG